MAQAEAATKTKPTDSNIDSSIDSGTAAAREAPVIPTRNFQWNAEGFKWREAYVLLPAGVVAQDLQDSPQMWRLIQSDRTLALKRLDRVLCDAHDGTWSIEARVAHADGRSVTLSSYHRISTPRAAAEYKEGDFVISWAGPGFAVIRKRDNVQVVPGFFDNIGAAKSEMYRRLFPQRVS